MLVAWCILVDSLQGYNMVIDFLREVRKKVAGHVLNFADQTVLHGPKYFINRGTIKGGEDAKTGKDILIKMSIFDRYVG